MVSIDDGSEQTKKRQRSMTASVKGHLAKAAATQPGDERKTSWLDYIKRNRQVKVQRSKSPGRRVPPRSKSGSISSTNSKNWQVKMPRQMVCTVMLIFLLIPLTIFWWKESHLHVHNHTEEHAVARLSHTRGHHNAFVTWMEDAEKEATSEHLLDKNFTYGDAAKANATKLSNQLGTPEQGLAGAQTQNSNSDSNKNDTVTANSDQESKKDDASVSSENDSLDGEIQKDKEVVDTGNGADGVAEPELDQMEAKETDQEGEASKEQETVENNRDDEDKESEANDGDEAQENIGDVTDENGDVQSQDTDNNDENDGGEVVEGEHRRLRHMIRKTRERFDVRRRLHHLVRTKNSTHLVADTSMQQWFLKLMGR